MKFKRTSRQGQVIEMISKAIHPSVSDECFSSLIHFSDGLFIAGSPGYIQTASIDGFTMPNGSYRLTVNKSDIVLKEQLSCNNFIMPEKTDFTPIVAIGDSLPSIIGAITGGVFNAQDIMNSVSMNSAKSFHYDDENGIVFIKTESCKNTKNKCVTIGAIAPRETSPEVREMIKKSRSIEIEKTEEKGKKVKIKTPPSDRPILTRNKEKNGIELRWLDKPSANILAILRLSPFRWNSRADGQPWWAKYSEENFIFAQNLVNKSEQEIIKLYQTTLSK